VVTDDDELARIARSIRDWGRDCYCAGGEHNTCGKRFGQQFGSLRTGTTTSTCTAIWVTT